MGKVSHRGRGILCIVTCAARSSEPMLVQDFVEQAQQNGWIVYVVATPQATKFIDASLLEHLTGYPILSEYRHPDEQTETLPKPDAVVVFPATFNTINKWALGIADTLALGLLCDYLGQGVPIVAVPCIPTFSLARHPAFSKSVALLREYGVHIIYDPEKYPPMNNVPWKLLLQAVQDSRAEQRESLLQKGESISR